MRIPVVFLALCLVLGPLTGIQAGEGATPPQPSYFELKPSLITNLAKGGKYVRADIQLMTLDPELLPDIELHAPAVRDALLMLLSEQDGKVLRTPKGKEELRQRMMEQARKVMRDITGKSSIDELLFTAFFVQ